MREIVLAASLMVSPHAKETEAVIRTYQPGMPIQQVRIIARAIGKSAAKYDLDPEILTAILAQESAFQPDVVSCIKKKMPNGCYRVTCDIGLAQINWESWGATLKLNPCLLRTDPAYAIDVAARILSQVRKGNEFEVNWWSRYHDGRPKYRMIYETLVLARMPDTMN